MIDKEVGNRCTGCNMCADVCPKKAIHYETNEEGFAIPKVDYNKCVKCGLCTKKCPAIKENNFKKDIPKVYATWTKDNEIRMQSTSGGMYYTIAQKFIQNGGYVVGCIYDKNYKGAHHIVGNTMEDLKKIMGTKYFQSNAEGIYKQVQDLLNKGEKVLFSGTPCQCAALQSFLDNEYENLFIIDIICRGINSPLAYKKFIEEIEEKYNSKVKLVRLRDKKKGWSSAGTYIEFENGKTYLQNKENSPWIKGWLSRESLFIRKSCNNCNFRGLLRISDITIGDFWGIKSKSKEDMFKGISCVMVNSKKGQVMLDSIKDNIVYERRNLEELLNGNPALVQSPEQHGNYSKFFTLLKTKKFSEAVEECYIKDNSNFIEKVLKKIYKISKKMKEIDIFKFIKYNFFSKNIVREKNVYLIPYKGTILDLNKNSKIYIKGKNLKLNVDKLKKSKAEMHLRMKGSAKWYVNNGATIFHNTVIEIKDKAVLNTGYFSTNAGSVIVCAKKINIGEDVMLGRNNIIYDSDFHQVFDSEMNTTNYAKEVNIEDHVWLTTNVTVLKGTTIGRDSLVTAQTLIRKDFPENSLIAGGATGKVVSRCNGWSRKDVIQEI